MAVVVAFCLGPRAEAQTVYVGQDTALFRITVASIVASHRPVRVDPQPLLPVANAVELRDAEPGALTARIRGRASIDSAVTGARRAILHAMAVKEADVSRWSKCPGVLVPPTPGQPDLKATSCPRSKLTVVAIGLPVPQDSSATMGRGSGAVTPASSPARAAVRVVVTSFGPTGFSSEESIYVFARSTSGWSLLRKAGSIIVE